jgi:adenosylcobinamide kinase/adenosylcobinamide-phosphate guanylyltransferase
MGRVYRDLLGWANQRLAYEADNVIFMVAGIPMVVKGV